MSDSVVFERRYPASAEQVFEAWTNVERLSRWYGCGPETLWDIHVWEPRAGGALHVSMEMEGNRIDIRGVFAVVDRPARLQYSWHENQTITVTFTPDGDGTLVRVEHEGLPSAFEVEMVTGGWSNSIEQLADALAVAAS